MLGSQKAWAGLGWAGLGWREGFDFTTKDECWRMEEAEQEHVTRSVLL